MQHDITVLLEDEASLKVIADRFNIEEQRFAKGLIFVQSVLNGDSKTRAYRNAFDVDSDTARKVSSQFHRGKWIQELLRYLKPDQDTLYTGEIKDIIKRGMEIINDPRTSNRDASEAMKALQPYIKAEALKAELELNVSISTGESISAKLNKDISILAANGKMVNELGEIIDVKLIE